jgi:hypothetical protein
MKSKVIMGCIERMDEIGDALKDKYGKSPTREIALAVTRLQEAEHWLREHLYVNQEYSAAEAEKSDKEAQLPLFSNAAFLGQPPDEN